MNQIEEIVSRLDAGDDNRSETASRTPNTSFDENDKLLYNENIRRLADYIGVGTDKIKDNSEKLEFLMEWSKRKADSDDITDALYELKKLKDKIGFQEIGETAMKKLFQYIRLSDEQALLYKNLSKISKEKELITNERKPLGANPK